MTLAEIRNKIKGRVDDTDVDTAMLNDAINEAYFEIINDSRTFWKFMEGTATFSTIAGTADYDKKTIDSTMDDIYDMYHNDGQLKSMNRREFDQFNYQNTASGIPTRYIEWDGKITLYPTPSDNRDITIRFYKEATELVDDSDKPLIPRKYMDVLVAGAKVAFYEMDEDSTRYDRALPSYAKKLKDMVEKNETNSDKTFKIKMAKGISDFPDWDYR